MADETARRYLFVAIDRATRWVFIRIYNSKTAANARRFLRDLERVCPLRIRTILTPFRDVAAQYPVGQWITEVRLPTGCLAFVNGRKAGSMRHEVDKLCTALDIEHRLVRGFARSGLKRSTGAFPKRRSPPPRSQQANGMVERFNGRIEDVLQSHHF